ncbi:MAG: hypothetical protein SLRJCFUN_001490, partial [Candidatus Fervidibacter sp.]
MAVRLQFGDGSAVLLSGAGANGTGRGDALRPIPANGAGRTGAGIGGERQSGFWQVERWDAFYRPVARTDGVFGAVVGALSGACPFSFSAFKPCPVAEPDLLVADDAFGGGSLHLPLSAAVRGAASFQLR